MRNLRETKEYKNMTSYRATGLAEGFEDSDNEIEILSAWQYLHDTRIGYYSLQGWFGRILQDLLERGLIQK